MIFCESLNNNEINKLLKYLKNINFFKMLSFSALFGTTSLVLRSTISSIPFPFLYKNMKDKHNPEIVVFPFLEKNTIFSVLFYSIIISIYAFNTQKATCAFIAYIYLSLLYFIYLNMYLYIMSQKNYMLLQTLCLVFISYLFFQYVHQNIIIVFCLLIALLNAIKPIQINKELLLKIETHEIMITNIICEIIISILWIVYGFINELQCFIICNSIFFIINCTGIIAYLYMKGSFQEKNCLIRQLKKIYMIKEESSEEKIKNLKETILKNEEI